MPEILQMAVVDELPESPKQEQAPPDDSQAGLDGDSFAAGGGGPSFRVGKTQMGDPNQVVRRAIEAPKLSTTPPKFTAAHAIERWRFMPASLDGRAVPSKRMIRIQFQLD